MFIFYSDNPERPNFTPPYHTWKATENYLQHYYNALMLRFIAKNTNDFREARQAEKELVIAEKKMTRWKQHPNYDHARVLEGIKKLKEQWNDNPKTKSRND